MLLWAALLLGVLSTGPAGAQVTGQQHTETGPARDQSSAPRIALEKIFKTKGGPSAVAWSPNGKLLATSDSLDRRITIWNYASHTALSTLVKTYVGQNWLTFTPDGRYLVTSVVAPTRPTNRISFSLIDVQTGAVVRNVDGPVERPGGITRNFARAFAISPNTRRAATITRETSTGDQLNFYETENWSLISSHNLVRSEKRLFIAQSIAFNPRSGELALLGIGGELEIWDAAGDHAISRLQAYPSNGSILEFNRDGRFAVTGQGLGIVDSAKPPDSLKLWDAESWKIVAKAESRPGRDLRAHSLSFSSDGRFLAALNYDSGRLWDARNLSFLEDIPDSGRGGVALSFAPDGRRLAIARNNDVRVVSIAIP
jgi:WD40 repeat protein